MQPTLRLFSQSWIYLGLVLCLSCLTKAYAIEKPVKIQPAFSSEKVIWPEISNDKDDSTEKASKLQSGNLEQLKTDLFNLDEKQKSSYSELDQKLKSIYLEVDKKILINTKDIDSQKFLVENYAAGGFETLLKMADLTEKVDKLSQGESSANSQKPDERSGMSKSLNRLWMLLAIVFVSLLPLAFVASGERQQKETSQEQTVLFICLSAFLGYFLIGFGLMFGTSAAGWIGLSSAVLGEQAANGFFTFPELMLYQVSFPILAALIINKAIGYSLSAKKNVLLAFCIGAVIVPIFGHWSVAGRYLSDNSGWLESAGFLDNAGSTAIHSIAAWFILVWSWRLGSQKPVPNHVGQMDDDSAYSSRDALFLWLSGLGLTTGVLSISSNSIASIMLNVGLAASAGGLSAYLHAAHNEQFSRGLGGFVAGLVAVGAAAPFLTNLEALLVGACAGLIHNVVYSLLRKHLLQQVWQVGAANLFAIHGAGGVWGSLCVALFGSVGLFAQPKISQLFSQLEGVVTALVYSAAFANVLFLLFHRHNKDLPR